MTMAGRVDSAVSGERSWRRYWSNAAPSGTSTSLEWAQQQLEELAQVIVTELVPLAQSAELCMGAELAARIRIFHSLLLADHPLPLNWKLQLVPLLVKVVCRTDAMFDSTYQTEIFALLHCLISRQKRVLREAGLQLDWEPLYERFIAATPHLFKDSLEPLLMDEDVQEAFHEAFFLFISHARRFFLPGAAKAIWSRFEKQIGPGGAYLLQEHLIYTALLVHLLPSNYPEEAAEMIPGVIAQLKLVDKCETSAAVWLLLLARLARHTTELQLDWRPHLPLLFQLLTHTINWDVGMQTNPSGWDSRDWPECLSSILPLPSDMSAVESIAVSYGRMLIQLLCCQSSAELTKTYFCQLLASARTALHPSNTDAWTAPLAMLISSWCKYYAKVVGRQRRASTKPELSLENSPHSVAVVNSVLDACAVGLYSESSLLVSAVEMGSKHLMYVHPALVWNTLRPLVFASLEAVTESHRTLSALCWLQTSVVPLVLFHEKSESDQGEEWLLPLLHATLPALDANDLHKSSAAITFYSGFFGMFKGMRPDAPDSSEFGDWILQLSDRVTQLVVQLDEQQHKQQQSTYISQVTHSLARFVHTVLVSGLADWTELRKRVIVRALPTLISGMKHNSKYIAAVLSSLAVAEPSFILERAIKLVQEEKEEVQLQKLYALCAVIKGVEPAQVLENKDVLSQIIWKALFVSGREEHYRHRRKIARKLLTNALRVLTTTRVAEDAETSEPISEDDFCIRWLLPDARALAVAKEWVEHAINTSEHELDENSDASENTIRRLLLLRAVGKGALPVLGDFNQKYHGSIRAGRLQWPSQGSRITMMVETEGKGASLSLRETLWITFREICPSDGTDTTSSTHALLVASLRLQNLLLSEAGCTTSSRFNKRLDLSRIDRKRHREYISGPGNGGSIVRPLLRERSQLLHMLRNELTRNALTYPREPSSSSDEFDDERLIQLVLHEDEIVRGQAIATMGVLLQTYPEQQCFVASRLLKVIACPSSRDQDTFAAVRVQAAAEYLAADDSLLLRIHRDSSLFFDAITTLCQHGAIFHDEDETQAAIHELLTRISRCMYRHQTHGSDQSNVSQALLSVWKQMREDPTQWRMSLAAMALTWQVLRNDSLPAPEVMHQFTAQIDPNVSSSRRTVAISYLCTLWNTWKPSPRFDAENVLLETIPSDTGNYDFTSDVFLDENEPFPPFKTACGTRYNFIELQPDSPANVLQRSWSPSEEWLRALLYTVLPEHHPELQNENSGVSSMSLVQELTICCQPSTWWPRGRVARFDSLMETTHVHMLFGLLQWYPDQVLPVFFDFIAAEAAVAFECGRAQEKRARHVTLAEVIVAVIRYFLRQPHGEELLQTRVFPELLKSISVTPLENVDLWTDALRLAIAHVDARRLVWLTEPLVQSWMQATLERVEDSSAMQRRTRWCIAILLGLGTRAPTLHGQVISFVLEHHHEIFAHATAAARKELAFLIFALMHVDRGEAPLQELVQNRSTASSSEDQDKMEVQRHWDTLFRSASDLMVYGDVCYTSRMLLALVEPVCHVLSSKALDDEDMLGFCRQAMFGLGWTYWSGAPALHFTQLLDILLTKLLCVNDNGETPSWRIRLHALTIAEPLLARHVFALHSMGRLQEVVDALLALLQASLQVTPGSPAKGQKKRNLVSMHQMQVATQTSAVLRALFSASMPFLLELSPIIERFEHLFRPKRKRSQESFGEESRHAMGLLGLCTVVAMYPHHVPEWLPRIIALLASQIMRWRASGRDNRITRAVQDCLREFRRTHQDTWHNDRQAFTPDQLEALDGAYEAPSYFV